AVRAVGRESAFGFLGAGGWSGLTFNSAGWLCRCANQQGSMSKWLKPFLFGIWGLLLIPLITPILKKWLEENVFDPDGMATTVFSNAMATTVFNNLLALSQRRWFAFALVFLTGIVIGVLLDWLNR